MRLPLLAASLLVAVAAACSSSSTPAAEPGDDDDDNGGETGDASSTPPDNSGLAILRLSPSREFSGFDGTHSYKVPIAVYGFEEGDDVTVTPDEAGSAVVTPVKLANVSAAEDSGKYFMIEVKKAGTLKLTAKSGSQTADASVSVSTYEPAWWEAGKARYENGGSGDPACKSCHVDGRAIDNSPAALASVADSDVARIVTLGVKTNRTSISTGCTDCTDAQKQHKWTVTDDETRGLVAYLRGLEPRGFD